MSGSCSADKSKSPLKDRVRTWDFWKPFVFTAVGAIGGYLYYHFVGCSTGSCAITGNPYASTAFGGLLGFFFVNRPCACG